jgi:hypothetical protein
LKQSSDNVQLFLNEGQGLGNNFLLPQTEFLVILGQNFLLPEAKFLTSWDRIFCWLRESFSHGAEFLVALGGI